MKFSEQDITVFKNFSQIHQSMKIEPTGVKVKNDANTCVGIYKFETPYTFEEIGIYVMPEFLSVYSAMKNPEIDVFEKYIVIREGTSKVTFFTTAPKLIPVVKDANAKFATLNINIDFIFSQEKHTMLTKMASLLKSEFIFIESIEGGKVRITVGDALESSNNTWEVIIDADDVTVSNATKPLRCSVSELRIINGDYRVKIAQSIDPSRDNAISHWVGPYGVEYFVGMLALK